MNPSRKPMPHDAADADQPASLAQTYAALREIASRRLRQERPDHTLQATALANEAWLRLANTVASSDAPPRDPAAFLAAASAAMRNILIDHARARASQKRGGDPAGRPARKLPLDAFELADSENFETILAVDDALVRLREQDADLAQLVELRFFVGLGEAEVAELLGASPRTIRRQWTIARAWLRRELGDREHPPPNRSE